LVSTLESSIEGLDPSLAALIVNHTVIMRVIEKPFTVNQDLEFEEALAEDVTISDDGETWDIKFREGVMFHPPYDHELTAEDVVRSFDHMSADGTVWQQAFNIVNNYEAVDDYTVQMELSGPAASLEGRLGYRAGYIMPKEVFDNDDVDLKNNPAGSGPFKFESWVRGEELQLTAFEDHFNPPNVDRVVRVTGAQDSILRLMEDQQLDLFPATSGGAEGSIVEMAERHDYIDTKSHNSSGFHTVIYHNEVPPLDDLAMRKALTWAIPKQRITDVIFSGFGQPADTMLAEDTFPYYFNPNTTKYRHDLDKAREVLEEAGYTWDNDDNLRYPE